MMGRIRLSIFVLVCCCAVLGSAALVDAQTLGGIVGTVMDSSGAVLPATAVTLVNDQTTLTRTQQTNETGAYDFVSLPIGTYTLTFTHDGFESQKIPAITVQADRTATVNATLKIGQVGTTITVEESPLLNAVDTTNGYILEKLQIESIPLSTGSFTGLDHIVSGCELRASERHRREQRPGKSANLGKRPARHQQFFSSEWSRRQQPL